MEKFCGKCQTIKPLSSFAACRRNKTGVQSHCKECRNSYTKKWQEENRERHNATTAEWVKNNKERKAKTNHDWYIANKEAKDAYIHDWVLRNQDRVRRAAKKRREEKKEHIAKIISDWARDNPLKRIANENKRRAAKRNSEFSHTAEEIQEILEDQGYTCANPLCCADLKVTKKHLDHIIPLSRGGSNGKENLQWLCQPCNSRKSSKTMEEFLLQDRNDLIPLPEEIL